MSPYPLPTTQLLLSVPNGGTPEQLYYGSRTSDADIRSICETARRRNAYPVYGMGYPCETALSVRHADGNLTLQMAVIGVKETRLTKENATLTVIELKDKVYPFFVNICYKAWQDADVIETWTEIRHEEKKPRPTSAVCFCLLACPPRQCLAVTSFRCLGQTKDNSARKRCNRV